MKLRAFALALALALAGSVLSVSAVAQEAAPAVRLDVPDCLGASAADVEHLVALELAPRMLLSDDSSLVASVACTEPLVVLEVRDPARAAPLRVELDLAAAAPLARSRLLALTLAELITTSQLERPVAPPASEPPAPDAPLEDASADADEADDADNSRVTLWVAPSIALATAPAVPLVGGDLGGSYALGAWLIAVGAHARFGQSDRTSSEVFVRSFGASLALTPVLIDRAVRVSAGPALHAGYAAFAATSRSSQVTALTLYGVWLTPAAQLALHIPLARPTALRCALEAGYYVHSVVGLDERGEERIALRGPWLSLSVGLALGL